ncbi:hypothetical protein [Geminocystis sp.]
MFGHNFCLSTANYQDTEEENEKYIRFLQEEIKIANERNQRLGNLGNL